VQTDMLARPVEDEVLLPAVSMQPPQEPLRQQPRSLGAAVTAIGMLVLMVVLFVVSVQLTNIVAKATGHTLPGSVSSLLFKEMTPPVSSKTTPTPKPSPVTATPQPQPAEPPVENPVQNGSHPVSHPSAEKTTKQPPPTTEPPTTEPPTTEPPTTEPPTTEPPTTEPPTTEPPTTEPPIPGV
jgi:hypothetical protein